LDSEKKKIYSDEARKKYARLKSRRQSTPYLAKIPKDDEVDKPISYPFKPSEIFQEYLKDQPDNMALKNDLGLHPGFFFLQLQPYPSKFHLN